MQRELCQGFLFSVKVSVEVILGAKLAQLRGSVGMHIDLTLLHSCTCVSCSLDHSSTAFALAHVASQNRLPFDNQVVFEVLVWEPAKMDPQSGPPLEVLSRRGSRRFRKDCPWPGEENVQSLSTSTESMHTES